MMQEEGPKERTAKEVRRACEIRAERKVGQ
jgi:hypothetical protein